MAVLRTLRDLTLAITACGAAFGLVFDYRFDYLGHFLGGAGGTLALLALASLSGRRLGWTVPLAVVAAIAIGAWTEATIFRIGIFDPVDFFNQSLGAAVAGAVAVDRRGSVPLAISLGVVSLVLVVAGFYFAFA